MRILHVVEPFSSGIITFIIALTRALPEHHHTVLHGERTTEDEIASVRSRFPDYVHFGIWEYADRSANPIKDMLALMRLIRYIRSGDYDVVHLHSAKAGFLGRIACWLLHKKNVIYTPNGAPFLRKDIGKLSRWVFQFLEVVGAKLTGEVICCGSSESEIYAEVGIKNIYINNGVKIGECDYKNVSYPIRIGSMAILCYQKNPKMFSEIAEYFKDDKRVEFVWVGNGVLRPLMDEKAMEVTGWVGEQEAAGYLDSFDIYMSTALWEGQPFAVLEAMQNSKCLLLSTCVGNLDLVQEGVNGYLFSNAEEAVKHIETFLANKELIEMMGRSSREICVKHHDLEKTGRAYDEQYKRISAKPY